MIPSPHFAAVHGVPGGEQIHPTSDEHVEEHPSPSILFPSSHTSPGSTFPSPHMGTGFFVQGPPVPSLALGHVYPDSVAHVDEHPSPLVLLPSSHVSPASTFPSPHTIVETHGFPGVGHV